MLLGFVRMPCNYGNLHFYIELMKNRVYCQQTIEKYTYS